MTVPPPDAVLPARVPGAVPPGEEFRPHHPPTCFGCGDVPGGLRMRFRAGEGLTVTGWYPVERTHEGAPGYQHGGALGIGFDEILGTPGMQAGLPAVTARLEIDFRHPIPLGSTVWLNARVLGTAGRKLYLSGEAHMDSPDGPIAAQARALYLRVDPSYFTEDALRAAGFDPTADMPG